MNNSFEHCLNNICGLEIASLCAYKYSVFGGNTVVVEGHKGIVDYSGEIVSFFVKGGKLSICGKQLKIKCLDKHFAVVTGQIDGVEVKL